MRAFVAVAAAFVTVVPAASACANAAASGRSLVDRAAASHSIVVGVKTDQPGLGLRTAAGAYTGLDVDVARYVAAKLGVTHITFKEATSANREAFLEQGQVDMVVASYSITPARKKKVSFAGPYLIAGQDILVRAGDNSITGLADLKHKKVCGAQGSTSPKRLIDTFGAAWQAANLTEQPTWSDCVGLLRNKVVEALSSDNTVCAGYAAKYPGQFKLVGKTFSVEKYGIGLRLSDRKARDRIDDILAGMFQDGSWKRFVQANLGEFGIDFPVPPPIERY